MLNISSRSSHPRICFYCVATHLGGAEKSLLELLKEFKKEGKNEGSWVLLPKADGPLVLELSKAEIPYFVLPMPQAFLKMSRATPKENIFLLLKSFPALVRYAVQWVKLLRSQDVNLIHTTGLKCHFFAAILKYWVQKPVLWHLRDILPEGWVLRLFRKMAKVFSIQLVANSQATAESFRGLDHAWEIPVVYNGFSTQFYQRNPNQHFREIFQCSDTVPIIGIIGVLARWKGQLDFLEMAGLLTRKGKAARFVIIGDRIYDTAADLNYVEELRLRVKELGLEGRVHFSGFIDDIPRAMNGMDLLIHASRKPEPFGRVIVEALGCEVPVIASAAGGVLEIIQDKQNGVLFSSGDIRAMYQAVEYVLDSPDRAREMARNGRKLFEARFSLESSVVGMDQVFHHTCSAIQDRSTSSR